MVTKPVVFISSTSDLRAARDLVGKVLYSMGYEPVWQDIAATDGGELLAVLRERIAPCTLVIQLVGQRYGAEPPAPTAEFGRVSYTQFEALYAEQLGRKVIYSFIDPLFPVDAGEPESEDCRDLQAAYVRRIQAANKLRQTNIASAQDLELSIRRINDELATVRRQADRRFRRMLWLIGGTAAGLALLAVLIVGGFYLVRARQGEQTAKIDQQTAKVRDQSQQLDRIENLLAAQKQAIPQAVPQLSAADQAILDQAKKQGDLKSRATASVLSPDAGTDALLEQLKAQQSAQAFDLLMLEGKRWYFDKGMQHDKAIPFFEQALALRPESLEARQFTASAYTVAHLGNVTAHQKRAIEITQGTLKLTKPDSADWARAMKILGIAWAYLPTGDRAKNLQNAIDCFTQSLRVYTRDAAPTDWAMTQCNLGLAWSDLPTGNVAENVQKAIDCDTRALQVFTRAEFPVQWAQTENNLGIAWWNLPAGDRAKNLQNVVACFAKALQVYTRAEFPEEWAMTQNNLGLALCEVTTGERTKNLQRAIDCFTQALQVRTREAFPADWAQTEGNLGIAWWNLRTGDRAENLQKAIDCYTQALQVFTCADFPVNWAQTQSNLGLALCDLPAGDQGKHVQQAIDCFTAALEVRTRADFPLDWARTQNNLGNAWFGLPAGDAALNLESAIDCYQRALDVYTRADFPLDWAMMQSNLGNAWGKLAAGDRNENRRNAIAAYEAALEVDTMDAYPDEAISLRINLSWDQLLTRDFKGAQATAAGASRLNPPNLPLETNLAHALLFLDRVDEARAIYLKHVGEKIGDQTWQEAILQDFTELERQGLTHPQINALREQLKGAR